MQYRKVGWAQLCVPMAYPFPCYQIGIVSYPGLAVLHLVQVLTSSSVENCAHLHTMDQITGSPPWSL